jgi:hypothetical protein
MFWLKSLPVLSDVAVMFLSPIAVLTPNGKFLDSVSYMQIWACLRCTKCFILRQRCKVNPLLHFYGNNQKFCIVVSGMWINSTKERHCRVHKAAFSMCLYRSLTRNFTIHRMHCCFTKAIVLTETRRSMTLHIHSVPCTVRPKPAVVYNVAHHNNVYVRNMSGFDITAKLCVLMFIIEMS